MDEITKIKLEMVSLGWDVEEKISGKGWQNNIGYTIWFSRSDWHGKSTYSITGRRVVFIGTTEYAYNYESVLKTIKNTAEKAKKAWTDFTDSIPCQNAKGEVIKDVMVYSFAEGKDTKKVPVKNQNRFDKLSKERE